MTKTTEKVTMNRANESMIFTEKQKKAAQKKIEKHFSAILTALKIDYKEDHNTADTPKRVAKMYIRELFKGRFDPAPNVTAFKNINKHNELLVTGPLTVKSMCSHHFIPVKGYAIIGVLPGEDSKLIGLSKYSRIVDHFSRRPQIQEELANQIADDIMSRCKPKGVAVKIVAEHLCMTHRGVNETHSAFDTTVLKGILKESSSAKNEFLQVAATLEKRYSTK